MAAIINGSIILPLFLDLAREEVAGSSVEDFVKSFLVSNQHEHRGLLFLNTSLGDPFEESVFDALLSSTQIKTLAFPRHFPGLIDTFARALQKMDNLQEIRFFSEFQMSEPEANEFFSLLCTSATVQKLSLVIQVKEYSGGFIRAFCRYIRESASLNMLRMYHVGEQGDWLSQEAFKSICDSISESSALEMILIENPPVEEEHVEEAAAALANAIANSTSLRGISVTPHEYFTMDLVCRALWRTDAMQNSEMCFFRTDTPSAHCISPSPSCWWKQLLAVDDIRLNLWPSILKKANYRHHYTCSHTPADIIFYLLKEKNDVLCRSASAVGSTRAQVQLSGRKRNRDSGLI